MQSRRLLPAALAVLVVSVAACGGGDEAAATRATDATSISAEIAGALTSGGSTASPFDAAAAQCVADGLIDGFGLERMVELTAPDDSGSTNPLLIFGQMTDDEMGSAMTIVSGCADLPSVVKASLEIFGFTPEGAVCVGESLTTAGFAPMFVESLLTGIDPTADGTGFGEAFLDALQTSCPDATEQMINDDLVTFGISPGGAACTAAMLMDSENLREVLTSWIGIVDDTVDATAVEDRIREAFTSCLSPEELSNVGLEPTTSTTTQP